MLFKKWLKKADKEIQEAVNNDMDKAFSTNKRKESLLIPYIQYKIIITSWYLSVATWILALATITLVLFR